MVDGPGWKSSTTRATLLVLDESDDASLLVLELDDSEKATLLVLALDDSEDASLLVLELDEESRPGDPSQVDRAPSITTMRSNRWKTMVDPSSCFTGAFCPCDAQQGVPERVRFRSFHAEGPGGAFCPATALQPNVISWELCFGANWHVYTNMTRVYRYIVQKNRYVNGLAVGWRIIPHCVALRLNEVIVK